ncbi:oligosaccharide flippase family protein [Parafrankia elaeagni]|uniref:oligosaccharide flippase family protein n=1 Tax=Parafrankia elaeagni TaxID=222534 RepID=UPI0007C728F5|nr:oligosaccharide flippase family protein [Parafrankia elaeagni]
MTLGRHRHRQVGYLRAVAETAGTGVLRAMISTVVGLIIARFLGSSGRGTYAAVFAYTMAAAAILELGLTSSVLYYTARLRDRAEQVIRTGAWLILGCGTVTAVVGYFVAPLILHGHPPEGVTALRFAFAVEPLILLGGVWTSCLQATDLRAWNLATVVQPLSYAVAVAAAVALDHMDILGVTIALIISMLTQCAAGGLLRCRQIPRRGRFSHPLVRPMMRYGLLNLTSRVPYLFNARLDQLILTLMVPPAALGNYAVAVSLSLLSQPITAAFGSVAMPKIAAARDSRAVMGQGILTSAILGSISIGAAGSLVICAIAPFLVGAVLGPSFTDVLPLLLVLAPGAAVFGTNKVLGDILRGFNRSGTVACAEGLALVLTVGLNALLLPVMGVMGAAIASSAAYGTAFLLLLRAVVRQTDTSPALLARRARIRARSAKLRTALIQADQNPN